MCGDRDRGLGVETCYIATPAREGPAGGRRGLQRHLVVIVIVRLIRRFADGAIPHRDRGQVVVILRKGGRQHRIADNWQHLRGGGASRCTAPTAEGPARLGGGCDGDHIVV